MKKLLILLAAALPMTMMAAQFNGTSTTKAVKKELFRSRGGSCVRPQSPQQNVTSSMLRYGRVSDPDGYTNIRKGPGTSYAITRRYQSGDYLYYYPMQNGWSRVYSGDKTSTFMGYMSTSRIVYINPQSNSNSYRSNSNSTGGYSVGYIKDPVDNYVNVRKGPGTGYAICGRLNVGTRVYYKPGGSWVKVYDSNKNYLGYVANNRIRK